MAYRLAELTTPGGSVLAVLQADQQVVDSVNAAGRAAPWVGLGLAAVVAVLLWRR